jgi:Rrf2 family protein
MIVSSRGRYALRVMIDLAEHADGGYTAMREVAQRQNISLKYLERIMPLLVKASLVEGVHGRGGGYRLTRDPSEYPIGEILHLTDGEFAPVACLNGKNTECHYTADCRTRPFWDELNNLINDYLYNKSIADLMKCGKEG